MCIGVVEVAAVPVPGPVDAGNLGSEFVAADAVFAAAACMPRGSVVARESPPYSSSSSVSSSPADAPENLQITKQRH